MSKASVRLQAAMLFQGESRRRFWAQARSTYSAEAGSKREREFFAIVEREYQKTVSQ